MHGHAYAGGIILALCHTYRAMIDKKAKACISEINLGMNLPPAMNAVCHAKLPINTYREMVLGIPYKGPRALEMGVV